jgi:hypothetical protein
MGLFSNEGGTHLKGGCVGIGLIKSMICLPVPITISIIINRKAKVPRCVVGIYCDRIRACSLANRTSYSQLHDNKDIFQLCTICMSHTKQYNLVDLMRYPLLPFSAQSNTRSQ